MRMYQYDKHLDFHALGREIKRKREAKGWTQEYLAQLVDLSTVKQDVLITPLNE